MAGPEMDMQNKRPRGEAGLRDLEAEEAAGGGRIRGDLWVLKKMIRNEKFGFWVTVIGFPLLLLLLVILLPQISPYGWGPLEIILLGSLFGVTLAAIQIIRNKDKYLKKKSKES